MKRTEITKTIIELSDEEKEILLQAGDILHELYNADNGDDILYNILNGTGVSHDLSDLFDISFVLNSLCDRGKFLVD